MKFFCIIQSDLTSVEVQSQYNPWVVVFFILVFIILGLLYLKSEPTVDYLGEEMEAKKFSEEAQKGFLLEDFHNSLDKEIMK